jgi:hypothetical protein
MESDAADTTEERDPAGRAAEPEDPPWVSAYEPEPGRVVLVERGNPDAWLATDIVVNPKR